MANRYSSGIIAYQVVQLDTPACSSYMFSSESHDVLVVTEQSALQCPYDAAGLLLNALDITCNRTVECSINKHQLRFFFISWRFTAPNSWLGCFKMCLTSGVGFFSDPTQGHAFCQLPKCLDNRCVDARTSLWKARTGTGYGCDRASCANWSFTSTARPFPGT